jgi:hypothetical protein
MTAKIHLAFDFPNQADTNYTIFALTMDKKLIYCALRTVFFLMLIFVLPSCEKCMNCQARNKKTGQVTETYPENCGKKKSLETQELTYRFNLPDSLELTCTRE